MIERGIVAKIKDNHATIKFDRRCECDKCHICTPSKDGMKVEIIVDNTLDANIGDIVEIDMGKKSLQVASVATHLIPLVLVGICVGIGYVINKLLLILLPILALILGTTFAVLIDRFAIRKKREFYPHMINILSNDEIE